MAKQIKAIKCPQCGSTQVDGTGEDRYRCRSCSTEFWLDSDDITIHHKHEYVGMPTPTMGEDFLKKHKRWVYLISAGFVLLFFFGSTLSSLCSRETMVTSNVRDLLPSSSIYDRYQWDLEGLFSFIDRKGNPILMTWGKREPMVGRSESKDGYFALSVDPDTKKIVKSQAMPEVKEIKSAEARELSDGRLYLIINKQKLYEINRTTYELREVTPAEDFPQIEELSKGIAEIDFYSADEEGLSLMTNLGKKYVLYPIIGKLYSDKTIWQQFSITPPNASTYTAFTFSSNDRIDYPDELIQLVKYQYRWQVGYPQDEPRFGWQKDYGGSGIFTDRSPYKKVFVLDWTRERSRLVSYQDFTPDAYYFSPKVLHYDAEQVLIAFRPTIASDSPYTYQCLDARTAEVKWTLQEEASSGSRLSVSRALRYKGGYLLTGYRDCKKITPSGKVAYELKVYDLINGEENN